MSPTPPLTVEEARQQLLDNLNPCMPTQHLSLHVATWRVLAEPIISSLMMPPATLSMMDGYAVNSQQVSPDRPIPVSARIAAGQTPAASLAEGSACRIFTGAMLPEGADCVIMQEDTSQVDEGHIRLLKPAVTGQHLRRQGEELMPGDQVLAAGQRLTPAAIGLCASLGKAEVCVYRTLTVALLATGSELTDPGNPLAPGKVYNANLYMIESLLRANGFDVTTLGTVADDLEETVARLQDAADFDAIITTGGVSVGEEDHVRTAVNQLGAITTWQVRMKPGKPFAFGNVKGVPFFGLPGNPVSAYTTFHLFALPALRKLQGLPDMDLQTEPVTADFSIQAGPRREYLRARIATQLGQRIATLYPNQGSAVLASTVWADGFVIVDSHQQVKPGDRVPFLPFTQFRQ